MSYYTVVPSTEGGGCKKARPEAASSFLPFFPLRFRAEEVKIEGRGKRKHFSLFPPCKKNLYSPPFLSCPMQKAKRTRLTFYGPCTHSRKKGKGEKSPLWGQEERDTRNVREKTDFLLFSTIFPFFFSFLFEQLHN